MSFRPGAASAFALIEDGLRGLTPRASRDAFEGLGEFEGGAKAPKAEVRAAPEDGAANRALIRLAARTPGLPASRIRLEAGATTRLKTILTEGGGMAAAALLGNRE
jgi:uncharacterized protein